LLVGEVVGAYRGLHRLSAYRVKREKKLSEGRKGRKKGFQIQWVDKLSH
jgi:hypothetical protein